MKMIMMVLGTAALLAGAALPASADTDVAEIAHAIAKVADPAATKIVKVGRRLPRETRFDNDELPFGSRAWWDQVERDQRGRR